MTRTVRGVVRGGVVTPEVPLALPDGTAVELRFEQPADQPVSGRMMKLGMLRTRGGQQSTLEDFRQVRREAQEHLEREIDEFFPRD